MKDQKKFLSPFKACFIDEKIILQKRTRQVYNVFPWICGTISWFVCRLKRKLKSHFCKKMEWKKKKTNRHGGTLRRCKLTNRRAIFRAEVTKSHFKTWILLLKIVFFLMIFRPLFHCWKKSFLTGQSFPAWEITTLFLVTGDTFTFTFTLSHVTGDPFRFLQMGKLLFIFEGPL